MIIIIFLLSLLFIPSCCYYGNVSQYMYLLLFFIYLFVYLLLAFNIAISVGNFSIVFIYLSGLFS